MRILSVGSLYPPHHLGGAELIWRSAVHHHRERGHEVRVLATATRFPDPDQGIAEDADVHRLLPWYWSEHAFPRLPHRRRLALERRSHRVLGAQIAEFRPDAVVFWSMGGMALSPVGRVAERLPTVGVLLDEWLDYGPRVDQWQRTRERLGPLGGLLARAAGVPSRIELSGVRWVFMSEALRDSAAAAGVDVAGSLVTLRGIDQDGFSPGPEREWEGELIYLGRIESRKGVAIAIEALAELPGARLRIVGPEDPGYGAELRDRIDALGLADRVDFERLPRDRVAAALRAADALLFPVLWPEPWGLVPLEAMASGVPVVASGRGGSAEYLRDGVNSLIYEPAEDAESLAAAVRRLADDPALRARLRSGGLEASRSLSAESFNDAVLAEVERAVAEGRR